MFSSMGNSGPNLTNTVDVVANKISLIQPRAVHQDITEIFSSNTDVSNLIDGLTPASIGLGNVANTAPSFLPMSIATYQAIANINATSIGLSNVSNTKASDLPVSTATQNASNLKAPLSNPSVTGIVNVNDLLSYKRNVSDISNTLPLYSLP